VFKRTKYRAKAAEHAQLAATSQSEEARQIHLDMAEWFLLLADVRSRSSRVQGEMKPQGTRRTRQLARRRRAS